ncbi:hypothetical protein PMAYCL1PPCAC_13871, partial [Pristionchus mayeri]
SFRIMTHGCFNNCAYRHHRRLEDIYFYETLGAYQFLTVLAQCRAIYVLIFRASNIFDYSFRIFILNSIFGNVMSVIALNIVVQFG